MTLAMVMAQAEEDLICDFAEVYHIYDYMMLPPVKAAILVNGLREDSRVKRKLSGQEYPLETYLLAAIADRLSYLVWFKTKDGQKGRNRPKSFVDALTEKREDESSMLMAFSSKEELDAALAVFEKKE